MTCVNCMITQAIQPVLDEDGRCFCTEECKDEYTEVHAPDTKNFYEEQVSAYLLARIPRKNVKAFFHARRVFAI